MDGVSEEAGVVGEDVEPGSLPHRSFHLLDFAEPAAGGDVIAIGRVDDALEHGDEVGVVVFVGNAHVDGQVVGADEDGADAGNRADRVEIFHAQNRFDHRNEERVAAFDFGDVLFGFVAGPSTASEHLSECLPFERAINGGRGEAFGVFDIFNVRDDNAVE